MRRANRCVSWYWHCCSPVFDSLLKGAFSSCVWLPALMWGQWALRLMQLASTLSPSLSNFLDTFVLLLPPVNPSSTLSFLFLSFLVPFLAPVFRSHFRLTVLICFRLFGMLLCLRFYPHLTTSSLTWHIAYQLSVRWKAFQHTCKLHHEHCAWNSLA